MSKKPIIGCLALQGCVERHRPHVEAAGAEFRAVKTPAHFEEVDGFILPGGESTTMLKLIERFELWDILAAQFAAKPVWGICAGSILLAEKAVYTSSSSPRARETSLEQRGSREDGSKAADIVDPVRASASEEARQRDDGVWLEQKSFGILPVTAVRNGYGRQLESQHADIGGYEVSFIRAPVLKDVGKGAEIIASFEGGPVWIRAGKDMATTFHPELTFDFPSPMHSAFADIVQAHLRQKAA